MSIKCLAIFSCSRAKNNLKNDFYHIEYLLNLHKIDIRHPT